MLRSSQCLFACAQWLPSAALSHTDQAFQTMQIMPLCYSNMLNDTSTFLLFMNMTLFRNPRQPALKWTLPRLTYVYYAAGAWQLCLHHLA